MRTRNFSYSIITTIAVLMVGLLLVKCTKKDMAAQPSAKLDAANKANALAATATIFIHPGILNTQQSLDIIANQANAGDADRLAAYQYVLNYCNTHSPSGNYKATVGVAGGVITPDETSFKGDALLSYALALRWAKTGTASYAITAKQILDGWANAFRTMSVTGDNSHQASLEASWAAPTFAAAAEIIKYYQPTTGAAGGWTTAENTQFVTFLNRLLNQYVVHATDPGYHNNWDISEGYAEMAIGVFEDDQTIYNNGENLIKTVLPLDINTDGSMPNEICGSHNDCVHFQYSLTGLSYAANIAGIQGDLSIYTASSSRLLAGYNYQYKWYTNTLSNPPTCTNCTVSGKIWPGINSADRHYNTTATNYIQSHYNPDSDGLPGGDVSFLCWTNYTHHNVVLN